MSNAETDAPKGEKSDGAARVEETIPAALGGMVSSLGIRAMLGDMASSLDIRNHTKKV